MDVAQRVPLTDGLGKLPAFFILPCLDYNRIHQIASLAYQLELLRKLGFIGVTLAGFPHDIDSPVKVALRLQSLGNVGSIGRQLLPLRILYSDLQGLKGA